MPSHRPDSARHVSRQYSTATKVALAIFSTVAALAVGELVARVTKIAPNFKVMELGSENCVYQRSTNPILGFELKPNYRDPDANLIHSYERTNAHGQRDIARERKKPSGTKRILVLGDSVVEGYGLPESDTIPAQLQRLVSENVEVLNFGVSAYCTLAEVELLATKGVEFQPDVVILLFVENDFDNFNREAFPLSGTVPRPAAAEWMFSRSHLFRSLCVELDLFHFGAEADPVSWNKQAIGDNNVVAGLQRLAQLADEYGFQPLVVIWPKFLDQQVVDVHFIDEQQSELVVESLARRFKLPCVRLSSEFRAHHLNTEALSNPRLAYSSGDSLHPSPLGSRLAARGLKTAIDNLARGALKPDTPRTPNGLDEIAAAKALGTAKPTYARVHLHLGNRHLKEQRYEQAIAEFENAIAENPQQAGAYNNLGLALLGAQNGDAEAQFRRALEVQPDFVQAHFNLARQLLRRGANAEAIDAYRRTLKLDPNHSGALIQLGIQLGKQRSFDEAKQLLERAVRVAPNNAEAHNNLAVIYAGVGRLEDAMRELEVTLRLNPMHQRARANLQRLRASPQPTR